MPEKAVHSSFPDQPRLTSASDYPIELQNMPFFKETVEMLSSIRDHDFNSLAKRCDDDFGIIDINVKGGAEIIRDRVSWENWFKSLFRQLNEMHAITWSEITHYDALKHETMGYSVVDFDQYFIAGEQRLKFSVIATIIWKKGENQWLESRYHSSLLDMQKFGE